MKIKGENLINGINHVFEYEDADSFESLLGENCTQTYAVCFYENKMVIVYHGKKNTWGLVGGTIEAGETFEETLVREIKEESNMEVLKFLPIGYQKVTDTRNGEQCYQLRYVCTVKPYGEFIADPAGSITKIALIEPNRYKEYFDWLEIGDRIVQRAKELLPRIL